MATHLPPVRDAQQRLNALDLANDTRAARAQVKHALKTRRIDAASVLALGHRGVGDKVCGRISALQLLAALPRWGKVKATRTCLALSIAPGAHLDQLTADQVDALELAVADNLAHTEARGRS